MKVSWRDVKMIILGGGISTSIMIPVVYWLAFNQGFSEGVKTAFKLLAP